MKMTDKTMAVLSNFSGFNDNMVISEGNVLKTMSSQKTVFAQVETDQTFENEMAIYNLSEFLNCLGLFENADLAIGERSVILTEKYKKIEYVFAKKDILIYPQKSVNFPEAKYEFDITAKDLSDILKAGRVMGLSTVTVAAENGALLIRCHNIGNTSSNSVDITLVEKTDYEDFSVSFKFDSLNVLDLNYHVSIAFNANGAGISRFENESFGAKYFIGVAVNG